MPRPTPLSRRTLLAALAIGVLPASCVDDPTGPRPSAPDLSTMSLERAGAPGSIVFHSDRAGNREIYRMDPDGSDPVRLTYDGASDYYPDISPNGRSLVFTSNRGGKSDIFLLDVSTGVTVNLTNTPSAAEDWARFSPDGQRVAFHGDASGDTEIYVLALRTGELSRVTTHAGADMWPDWSPDGKRLAIRRDMDIYVIDVATGDATRLTALPSTLDQMAVWSQDGQRLAFMSFRDGYCAVFLMNADGSGQTNLTPRDLTDTNSAWCSRAPAWTRNGEILFMSFRPAHAGNNEIYVMNADGTGATRLTDVAGEDGGPRAR